MSWEVIQGDCIERMAEMEECSVDAVVCDPPYGIGFMGHEWDQPGVQLPEVREGVPSGQRRRGAGKASYGAGHERDRQAARNGVRFGGPTGKDNTTHSERGGAMHAGRYDLSRTANQAFQAWCEAWARECFRVLKPGGHLLASCGTRTYHRLAAGVEDAGFEIRDSIMWLYGSGFPKSLDVSKAIDKAAGAEREVVGPSASQGMALRPGRSTYVNGEGEDRTTGTAPDLTAPATPEAAQWEGWGTALKPAHEPIVVARKPLIGTVAENVLQHGTGAINVDACRVETEDDTQRPPSDTTLGLMNDDGWEPKAVETGGHAAGRWPANVVLSEEAAAELDAQSGELTSGSGQRRPYDRTGEGRSAYGYVESGQGAHDYERDGDSGGASRFFYCAKTSRAERNAGLEGFEVKALNWSSGEESPGTFQGEGTDRSAANHHPTVKPINLMRWLVRLVTPPGGRVLDPFLGSGSTGCAAVLEGFDFLGIEREPDYIVIAKARIDFWSQHEGREVEDVLQLHAKSTRAAKEHVDRGQGDLLALATEPDCTCSYDAILTADQANEQIAACPRHGTSQPAGISGGGL